MVRNMIDLPAIQYKALGFDRETNYLQLPSICHAHSCAPAIKADTLESWPVWRGILWLTTVPPYCESCQLTCSYCCPAVIKLTYTATGSLLRHPWPPQRGRCVFVAVCVCIHTCLVFVGEVFPSHVHIVHPLSGLLPRSSSPTEKWRIIAG